MKKGILLLTAWSIFLFATVAAADEEAAPEYEAAPENEEAQSYLIEPIEEVKGPKRTVAVGGFDATGAFTATYGDWDIGGGLAAMLTSALVDSGQFIVIERAALSDLLLERELNAAGITGDPGTGYQTGGMAGVQLLIYGAVTEFDTREKGGGLSLGLSKKLWKGGLGSKKTEGEVAFDFRIVDVNTGQVIESHSVSRTITAKGFDMSVGYEGVSLGDDNFQKTPLGQASREAITEAVHLIAKNAAGTAWTGSVVEMDGREMYINAGLRTGVQFGDEFVVERVNRVMTDPETGEVLLVDKSQLGTVRVLDVLEKLSVGIYQPTSNLIPRRGDLVVLPVD